MTDRPTPLDPPEGEPSAAAEPAADTATKPEVEADAQARNGVLTALWGNPRRRLVFAACAVVVVAAVVVPVVVTTSGNRPVPSGEMPVLDDQFAPSSGPTPRPSTPAGPAVLPEYSGAPLWTLNLPDADDGDLPSFAGTDHGFVVQTEVGVVGQDRMGREIWQHNLPGIDDFTVKATGPQVFVSYRNPDEDRWPQPRVIIALNAATGAELWRETEASFWSVTTDTIYMSVCYGGQNDHVGDCTFTARAPGNNAVRWSTPTYASSRVVNDASDLRAAPTPPVLLIGAYPTGHGSFVVSAHDPATGALLGRGFQDAEGDIPSIDLATERTVVTVDDDDENPANGCTATLTGFSVSGANQIWQYTAGTAKTDDGRRCGRLPISYNGDKLGVTTESGAPSVLNLNTGTIEWSAPAEGEALAAGGSTLLVLVPAEDDAVELVAYQVGNATPLWRAPFPGNLPDIHSWNVRFTAGLAVLTSYGSGAAGYDLKSGDAWSYGDSVREVTPAGFIACTGIVCRGYATG